MPAKYIKRANIGKIVFLSDSNYEQLYSSILFTLGENAPFASAVIQKPSICWIPSKPGDYLSINEAPEELKGALGLLWQQTQEELRPKLAAQELEFVLEIPDLSYIFYTENKSNNDGVLNHRFQLLVTGWACQHVSYEENSGDYRMMTRIHDAQNKHQNVIVCMVDESGQPIVQGDFIYSFEDSQCKDEKTDTAGLIKTGLCVVGTKLTYTYKLTGQMKSITVQKNIETYTITFAPTTDFHIKVIDQHDNPLQAHSVRVDYGERSFSQKTDGLGELHIENVLYTSQSLQVMITVEGYAPKNYTVTCPACNITIRIQIQDPIKPYLKIVRDGKTVADHSVTISGKINGTYASNAEGIIQLDGLQIGDTFEVKSASDSNIATVGYLIVTDQEEYIYELPIPQTPPEDKPETQACHVKIVRKNDHKPVPNYSLQFESSFMNGARLSDNNGIIPLENATIGTTVKVFKSKDSNAEEFQIEKDKVEYVIFVGEEAHEDKQKCHIKIVDEGNMIVKGLSVKVAPSESNGYLQSDDQGIIPIGELVVGTTFRCHIPAENQVHPFVVVKGQEEYIITVKQKPKVEKIDCHIKVVEGSEQIPVGNFSLNIESDTMQGFFLTDTYGILPLENMSPGMKVSCYVDRDSAPIVLNIQKGKEEYLIQIDKKPEVIPGDIMITLVDKDKTTPVTPAMITLTNRKGEKFTQRNDANGSIIVPKKFFTHNEKIHFHAENEKNRIRDCKFKYTADCDHYLIYLTNPRSWKWLMWLFLLPLILLLSVISCERDITVHTIDSKGQSISNVLVQLKYNEHALYKKGQFFYNCAQEFQGITGGDGYYTFQNTPCSVYSYIFYSLQKALATGSRNAISGGATSFFYHWQKNVDIIISNSKLVQVLSRSTNEPIPQARVDVNKKNADVVDSTMITDLNGMCLLKTAFDDPITHIVQLTATKTGYSGTRLSDITIDEDDPLPLLVYLDEPDPCQDQGANNNDRSQGNLAMKDYDMGKDEGEFIFNYYTDTAPDDISVYNGSSSEYVNGTATCIFHYNGATCTTTYEHFESIKFTSRYICVVVKGGSNWGYIVQCPFA